MVGTQPSGEKTRETRQTHKWKPGSAVLTLPLPCGRSCCCSRRGAVGAAIAPFLHSRLPLSYLGIGILSLSSYSWFPKKSLPRALDLCWFRRRRWRFSCAALSRAWYLLSDKKFTRTWLLVCSKQMQPPSPWPRVSSSSPPCSALSGTLSLRRWAVRPRPFHAALRMPLPSLGPALGLSAAFAHSFVWALSLMFGLSAAVAHWPRGLLLSLSFPFTPFSRSGFLWRWLCVNTLAVRCLL